MTDNREALLQLAEADIAEARKHLQSAPGSASSDWAFNAIESLADALSALLKIYRERNGQ